MRLTSLILLKIAFVRIKVTGMENIPRNQAVLLAANHPGFIDFLIHYYICPFKFRYVVAFTFFKIPGLKQLATRLGLIPVGEKKRYIVVMEKTGATIISAIKNKETIFVFPEGQRKKEPGQVMAHFRTWAARIAQATEVPIVPIAVKGSEKILPKLKFLIHPGTVNVVIGKPFTLKSALLPGSATAILQNKIFDLYHSI